MNVLLRGHHLICLNFYKGKGYSQDFIQSLDKIMKRARVEAITIVDGSDDVCKSCPYLKDDKCSLTKDANNEIMAMDNLALGLLDFTEGMYIRWTDITERLPKIIQRWRQKCCLNCLWREVCEIDEVI